MLFSTKDTPETAAPETERDWYNNNINNNNVHLSCAHQCRERSHDTY